MKFSKNIIICLVVSVAAHVSAGFVLYFTFKNPTGTKITTTTIEKNEVNDKTPSDTQGFVISPSAGKKSKIKPSTEKRTKIHTVKVGEGYWVIARKYKITIVQLLEFNDLETNHVLKSGDKLKIPQ